MRKDSEEEGASVHTKSLGSFDDTGSKLNMGERPIKDDTVADAQVGSQK